MATEPGQLATVSAVLCVSEDALRRFGRSLRHLAVGLIDQAVTVRLLSPDKQASSLSFGPIQSIIHDEPRWPMKKRRLARIIDTLTPQPPDVVHALSLESYELGHRIADHFDADLVCHASSLADCQALETGVNLNPDRVSTTSELLSDRLRPQKFVADEHVVTIPLGVLAAEKVSCFRREDRPPALVCMSNLESENGIDRLLEAAADLRRRGRELLLFLLGRGRQDEALRRLVRRLDLTSVVTFATPMGDKDPVLRSADIFIIPAEETAASTGGLHAMGEGALVITMPSRVGNHYRDGHTAIVCTEPTAASLAAAIDRALADREFARRVARSAQDYVRTHHSVSAMAEKTTALYRSLAMASATIPMRE